MNTIHETHRMKRHRGELMCGKCHAQAWMPIVSKRCGATVDVHATISASTIGRAVCMRLAGERLDVIADLLGHPVDTLRQAVYRATKGGPK